MSGVRRFRQILGLKLRLAISREVAVARRGRFEGVMVRLENAFAGIHGSRDSRLCKRSHSFRDRDGVLRGAVVAARR